MSAAEYSRQIPFEQTYVASLLLHVSKIAAKEVRSKNPLNEGINQTQTLSTTPSPLVSPIVKVRSVSFNEEEDLVVPRKVSPELTPVTPVASPSEFMITPRKRCSNLVSSPRPSQATSKFVGHTSTCGTIKAELRRKFAWKDYPELERFLMDRRVEYFQHSQKYNYTSTQKDYNNSLTTELIELANSIGYVFDGFTFAMIRDRIRCYYKSYVQAIRKGRRFHGLAGD
uniref:Uncharacterized protein n=1 Tax=Grammatophora oceanica TaxID=210454 RepID=A0A7S1YJF8_9STRA|mmetsp:Transcript_5920/g.8415  ORF Transcript_5920/g.8415 Transcript_5920/m.8415 type:complete len:227 (+) Transcript_5920:103-783(+)|eukprot:CAMPEP_0194049286 /NCGR_PEP_ID=MMETSP0009_2-20130614/30223_1 /TAXON_ID=210454 /ORGANISM="Grammatophora oceanica, Strain CCMP 410" /LENGTH=226 /DNA_ID=CAMNT_0038695397 /DNA_START=96 /DNA_END=776 /DNA_ORIENTATION=+